MLSSPGVYGFMEHGSLKSSCKLHNYWSKTCRCPMTETAPFCVGPDHCQSLKMLNLVQKPFTQARKDLRGGNEILDSSVLSLCLTIPFAHKITRTLGIGDTADSCVWFGNPTLPVVLWSLVYIFNCDVISHLKESVSRVQGTLVCPLLRIIYNLLHTLSIEIDIKTYIFYIWYIYIYL